jgi:hypothetical protein
MLIHKDKVVSSWVTRIKLQMANMCEDDFVIPMIALFYNDAATRDILESKRRTRLELAEIEERRRKLLDLPWYLVGERLSGLMTLCRDRMAFHIREWTQKPPVDAMDSCLGAAEFEFLKYLYILTQRITAWRAFPQKQLPPNQIPKEFFEVKGRMDAPLSVHDNFCRIQEVADAFIPPEMQRTMFAVMLSEMLIQPEQQNPAHKE